MNILLIYAHLLLTFAITGAVLALLAALVALLTSLGIYEAHMGLALLWPLLLLVHKRHIPRTRRLLLLTPIAIGLIFSVWRIVGVAAVGVVDNYIPQVESSPIVLLERLVATGKMLFLWSWAVPVLRGLGIQNNWVAWAIIGALLGVCWGVAAVLLRRKTLTPALMKSDGSRDVRSSLVMVATGLALVVAGYFPIILLMGPTLSGVSSRVHLFASIGASVVVAAVIYFVSSLLFRSRVAATRLTLAGLIPLIVLGTLTQAWVQRDARLAWQEQKDIWQQLFILCPDLEEDTAVYFVLPGYQERSGWANWQRTPLEASWEVSAGLRVLYEQQDLSGDVLLPDIDRSLGAPELNQDGVVNYWSQNITPYSGAVFVSYNGTPRQLNIVEDLRSGLALPWNPDGYAPQARCLSAPMPEIENRRLVASGS